MALRDKFERPLRRAIRDTIASGQSPLKMRALLFHPGQLARLCAQAEVLAASKGESGRLDGLTFGDEATPGFMEILAFLMAHWSEILQLALVILPMVVGEDGTTASEDE